MILNQFQILTCVTSRIDGAVSPVGFDFKNTVVENLTLLSITGINDEQAPSIFPDNPRVSDGWSCGDLILCT